jgi:peroxiredoxin
MEAKPFALIGVNISENSAADLKKVMEKERLNWRSFADSRREQDIGAIATRWNLVGTPALYVLDHKGVIRHKWVGSPGDKVMDEAIERLVKEAEADDTKGSK